MQCQEAKFCYLKETVNENILNTDTMSSNVMHVYVRLRPHSQMILKWWEIETSE